MYLKQEDVKNNLIVLLKTQPIDGIDDLFRLIKLSMEFVEGFIDMNGDQKRGIVKDALTNAIHDSLMDDGYKFVLVGFIDPTIDAVISITKKKVVY